MALNVELGGGPFPAHGDWVQVDLIDWKGHTGLDYVIADARKLPFDDESVDRLFASNLLEHFSWRDTTEVLKEWRRVLVVGGELTIVVPDILGQIENFHKGVRNWDDTVEMIGGSQDYELNHHLAWFTRDTFADTMHRAGAWDWWRLDRTHAGDGLTAVVQKRR